MRIKQISVKKLFGMFDHVLPLNTEDRITIIHGPNGVGKTALLRLLYALFNSQREELQSIPFERFEVQFDDDSTIILNQFEEASLKIQNIHPSKIEKTILEFIEQSVDQNGKPPNVREIQRELSLPLSILDYHLKVLETKGYIVRRRGGSFSSNLNFSSRNFQEKWVEDDDSNEASVEKWLKALRKVKDIHLIETQRLVTSIIEETSYYQPVLLESNLNTQERFRGSNRFTVIKYSKELIRDIQDKLTQYAELSQALDRTFPARLIEQNSSVYLGDDELRERLNALEKKRLRLVKVGLLDAAKNTDFQIPQRVDDSTRNVLAVYVEDIEQKLGIFDAFANKIEFFLEAINERFHYKKMSITKEDGFVFKTFEDVSLSATELSSGEQHELVLLYELLFKVKSGSLVLIDEPEISLHIAWQAQFLKDLQKIIELADFDVILATHSPDIIADRWDLTVGLKGPVEANVG